MKTNLKLHLAVFGAAFVFASAALAAPSDWPPNYPTRVTTKAAAMNCCLPGEKVALACKDCKTVTEKSGTEKKGILAWFKPNSTHGCPGCGGKVTVKPVGGGKASAAEYQHTCSKCGPGSAFTCATHKG